MYVHIIHINRKEVKYMAVQNTLVNTAMSIRFKAGIDALGNDIVKAKKYSNVKVTAADADVLLIATTLGTLMKDEVLEIVRSNDSLLINA
jgi:hypothetical protein